MYLFRWFIIFCFVSFSWIIVGLMELDMYFDLRLAPSNRTFRDILLPYISIFTLILPILIYYTLPKSTHKLRWVIALSFVWWILQITLFKFINLGASNDLMFGLIPFTLIMTLSILCFVKREREVLRTQVDENNNLRIAETSLEFRIITGELIGQDRHSETSMSGGVTINGQSSGVSSQTTTTQDFWLKLDNGHEEHVRLTNQDLVLRTGQRVSVAYVKHGEQGSYHVVLIANHSSNNYRDVFIRPNFEALAIPQKRSRLLWTLWPVSPLFAVIVVETSRDAWSILATAYFCLFIISMIYTGIRSTKFFHSYGSIIVEHARKLVFEK